MQDKERLDNKRGIDKELQAKLASKFDVGKADACMKWIAECTKKDVTGDFGADLKDGYLLCQLLKHISSKTYKDQHIKAKPTKQPFVCRTQIQNFVKGCKVLGMSETDVCSSQDLYEGDNLNNVVNHLYALNAICYKLESEGKYKGPFIVGAHTKFAKENKRNFSKEVLNHAKYITPLQMRGGIADDSKTDHDAYGIIKTSQVSKAKGVIPKLAQGGKTVESSNFDGYGIIKSTEKSTGGVPLLSQAKEQPKGSNFDSYGIVKSTEKATGGVPLLAQAKEQPKGSNFDSYGIVKSTEKASNAVPLLAQAKEQPKGSNFDSYGIVKKADDDYEMKTVAKADV